MAQRIKKITHLLQEFSLPLIAGVVVSLIYANVDLHQYEAIIHYQFGSATLLGHKLTVHYLINDIFMVLFFGIAAKEITESVLPGGDLNPPSRAVNPLLGTLGGVFGPVGVYFLLVHLAYSGHADASIIRHGWGVPTATDIALAWLVARVIFGARHAAVSFLLLLAVADDAIGLGIIAVVYPKSSPEVLYLLYFTAPGMILAYIMRKKGVRAWLPYVAFAGVLSWIGFSMAHLHPALALVPIVPFMPGPSRDTGLYVGHDEVDEEHAAQAAGETVTDHHDHSTLHEFEHNLKLPIDLGLFFFGFANAGVPFTSINTVTWIVLASLILGKMVGITFFSWFGTKIGFPLPDGMSIRHLVVAGIVAGLGLTVALFVAGEAFKTAEAAAYLGPAKMGAVFSAGAGLLAYVIARAWGIRPESDGS